MPAKLEVLFTPAEFATLPQRDLSQTVCVVFDVFRATSTIITALANGALAVIPVAEISDALALRKQRPEILLAGEREGQRILAAQSGGVDFDFGNSPREFTKTRVQGKTIAITTTNGSQALRACAGAQKVLAGSFLNLQATADHLAQKPANEFLLVCSGTGEHAAYEDILGAGALVESLKERIPEIKFADSAHAAWQIYKFNSSDLLKAVQYSSNGRRLLALTDLRDDIAWCLQRDLHDLVVELKSEAMVRIV